MKILIAFLLAALSAFAAPVRTIMVNTNGTLAQSDTNFFKANLAAAQAAGLGGSGSGVTNNQVLPGTPTTTNGNFVGAYAGNAANLTNLQPSAVSAPIATDNSGQKLVTTGGSGTAGLTTLSTSDAVTIDIGLATIQGNFSGTFSGMTSNSFGANKINPGQIFPAVTNGQSAAQVASQISTNLNGILFTNIGKSTNIFYLSINGNDTGAKAGDIQQPFKTFAASIPSRRAEIRIDASVIYDATTPTLPYGINLVGETPDTSQLQFKGTGTWNQAGWNHVVDFENDCNAQNVFFNITNVPGNIRLYANPSESGLTNSFFNCSFFGGEDNFVYDSAGIIRTFFRSCKFKSGWDNFAGVDGGISTDVNFGWSSNSLISIEGCTFDSNTNYDALNGSRNISAPAQSVHVFNLTVYPSINLRNCYFKMNGGDVGLFRKNGAWNVITNSTLIMENLFFDLEGPNIVTPLDFVNLYRTNAAKIFVQNVSWVSNGVFYTYSEGNQNFNMVSQNQHFTITASNSAPLDISWTGSGSWVVKGNAVKVQNTSGSSYVDVQAATVIFNGEGSVGAFDIGGFNFTAPNGILDDSGNMELAGTITADGTPGFVGNGAGLNNLNALAAGLIPLGKNFSYSLTNCVSATNGVGVSNKGISIYVTNGIVVNFTSP